MGSNRVITIKHGEFIGIKFTIDNINVVEKDNDVFYEVSYTIISDISEREKDAFDLYIRSDISKMLTTDLNSFYNI